ncbi:MAG TPA: hypothetical protein VJR03_07030 [Nitrospira sp.]|nr:hypothetical protein [Nitrospira sp.]
MSDFLFIVPALRERTSEASADLQLSHGVWGLCTALIRSNLQTYLLPQSRGLVYVLKIGLCAAFNIVPPVHDFSALDEFLKDELRTEARHGFVRIDNVKRWTSTAHASQALLLRVLKISDQAELTRRLALGMHRLTHEEYEAILDGSREGGERG